MGIKKEISKIVDHVYCAMCGQRISFDRARMDNKKQPKIKIQCPGCRHDIYVGSDHDNP